MRAISSKAIILTLAALSAIASVLWLRTQQNGAVGPSITELAKQPVLAHSNALSARIISKEDLPPTGTRSLFDHLIAQNDGLPYPFEKLVALLQKQAPDGAVPLRLMIPNGRSLLKAQASDAHPRVLIAADFQAANTDNGLGLAPRGQLFFAFVENAAEIEVLSYNEAAGRFEFQLVQDYREGGIPRIVYARRAICTTCHQGAAPIFAQRPWNETSGQPEVAARIVAARKSDQPYLGVPPRAELSVPERYDELTDVANFIPATQRAWLDGCGDGSQAAECRRQMLRVALHYAWNPGEFGDGGEAAKTLRSLQARAWPSGGIAVAESDLANRDPLAESHGWRGWLNSLFARNSAEPGAKDNEDLAAFERLPKLPAALDPLSPRPPKAMLQADQTDGAYGLAALLTAADVATLESAAGHDVSRLDQALTRLDAATFAPAPFSRVQAVNLLLRELNKKPLDYCCLDTSEMSPPVASGVPPLAISDGSVLKLFEQYCFACHRGNPAAKLNFMAGANQAEVLASIKAKSEIRDALDWERYQNTDKANKMMPPADSHQRAILQAALAQNPQLLEEMRETVPGLFDF